MKKPKLFIGDRVIQAARILTMISNGKEWAGELWGTINRNSIEIDSLLLHKQVVGLTEVNQSLDKATRTLYRSETMYYHMSRGRTKGKRLLGWIHSHGNMPPFLSETDRKQVDQYLKEVPYLVSVVVSATKLKIRRWNPKSKITESIKLKIWFDGEFKGSSYTHTPITSKRSYRHKSLYSSIDKILETTILGDYDNLVTLKLLKSLVLSDFI